MSASSDLRLKALLALGGVRDVMQGLREHPRFKGLLPAYLTTVHAVTRASVPLLVLAEERAKTLAPTDPIASAMVGYLAAHAREERGHDNWILDNLGELGVQAADVFSCVPSPEVAALVGAQYYWINYAHPVSIFGYMMVVERCAATHAQVDAMRVRAGLEKRDVAALLRHAKLDELHGSGLEEAIDAMPHTPASIRLMGISALSTVKFETAVWRRLIATFDEKPARSVVAAI